MPKKEANGLRTAGLAIRLHRMGGLLGNSWSFRFFGVAGCTLCEYVVTMTTPASLPVCCPRGFVALTVGASGTTNKNGLEME
jgi:hypothetical protein